MTTSGTDDSDGCAGGCLGLFLVLIVIALIVMAVISFAALIDPFDWLPPVGQIWADCQDDRATSVGECDLATRFPGFWGHVAVNLVWAAITGGLLVAVTAGVPKLRERRRDRFNGPPQAESYRAARRTFAIRTGAAGLCALVSIMAAVL